MRITYDRQTDTLSLVLKEGVTVAVTDGDWFRFLQARPELDAASMLLRSTSAASESLASKPRVAVVSAFFPFGPERPRSELRVTVASFAGRSRRGRAGMSLGQRARTPLYWKGYAASRERRCYSAQREVQRL